LVDVFLYPEFGHNNVIYMGYDQLQPEEEIAASGYRQYLEVFSLLQ
jgi:hypothetical protein